MLIVVQRRSLTDETYEQFELVARAWAVVITLVVGRFVCHLTGTVVIFLKLLVKVNDDFQVRARQWYLLIDSEGMSSTYYVLDLHSGSISAASQMLDQRLTCRPFTSSLDSQSRSTDVYLARPLAVTAFFK